MTLRVVVSRTPAPLGDDTPCLWATAYEDGIEVGRWGLSALGLETLTNALRSANISVVNLVEEPEPETEAESSSSDV